MVKRLFDVTSAILGLVIAAPVLAIAALGIRLSSPGPILYRARRAGAGGRPFTMYKLRTMHVEHGAVSSRVTAVRDPRVFPIGRLLRYLKIDELPQLVNVLRGEMSIIGPRPEDPEFVERHYASEHRDTLAVRPGLASPGSLYHDTHGDGILADGDPEERYLEHLLPMKLALDMVYVRRASLRYDFAIIARTLSTIAAKLLRRPRRADPPEMTVARQLLVRARRATRSSSTAAALLTATALIAAACTVEPEAPSPIDPPDSSEFVLAGAGDIASCGSDGDEATAALLDHIPGTVFTAGDNAYPDGSAADYSECYAPTWGRHRERTRPAVGNHEYHTEGAAGYFGYFGAAAGDPDKGYYSYEKGSWHVVVLNSEIDMGPDSEQVAWLQADLATHPNHCTLAYWHRPLFSSGGTHGGNANVITLWEVLYAAGAEIVLTGHEHHYERFAPQTPQGVQDSEHGIRQFVVGTGGGSAYDFGDPAPNSIVRRGGVPGVLAITLLPSGYTWEFVAVEGESFTDGGSGVCHGPPPGPQASLSGSAVPTAPVVADTVGRRVR